MGGERHRVPKACLSSIVLVPNGRCTLAVLLSKLLMAVGLLVGRQRGGQSANGHDVREVSLVCFCDGQPRVILGSCVLWLEQMSELNLNVAHWAMTAHLCQT